MRNYNLVIKTFKYIKRVYTYILLDTTNEVVIFSSDNEINNLNPSTR